MKNNFTRLFVTLLPLGLTLMVAGLFGVYLVINKAPHLIPEPVKALAQEPDLLEGPEAKRCAECHETIFKSWEKGRHAISWTSEGYVKDSEDRSKEKCLPCHIPREIRSGEKPSPRLERREEGIYCVSCHVKDKKMVGPYDLYAPPHPTRQDTDYRKSVYCGSCHEKTTREWKATGVLDTCQDCHMPRAEGRLTQKFPLNLFHRLRNVADHSVPAGKAEEKDVAVRVEFQARAIVVGLLNKSVPHHLPTADNGDPRMYLVVTLYDAEGEEVDEFKEILAPQQDTALIYGKEKEYRFPLFGTRKVDRVRVSLKIRPAYSKERRALLEKSFSNPQAGA